MDDLTSLSPSPCGDPSTAKCYRITMGQGDLRPRPLWIYAGCLFVIDEHFTRWFVTGKFLLLCVSYICRFIFSCNLNYCFRPLCDPGIIFIICHSQDPESQQRRNWVGVSHSVHLPSGRSDDLLVNHRNNSIYIRNI